MSIAAHKPLGLLQLEESEQSSSTLQLVQKPDEPLRHFIVVVAEEPHLDQRTPGTLAVEDFLDTEIKMSPGSCYHGGTRFFR